MFENVITFLAMLFLFLGGIALITYRQIKPVQTAEIVLFFTIVYLFLKAIISLYYSNGDIGNFVSNLSLGIVGTVIFIIMRKLHKKL